MNSLFFTFLSLSISGSVLALFLLVLRPLLKKYTSKTWQYYIFLIVLVRLILPVGLEIPVTPAADNASAKWENISAEGISQNDAALFSALYDNTNLSDFEQAGIAPSLSASDATLAGRTAPFDQHWQSMIHTIHYLSRYLWIFWFSVFSLLLTAKIVRYRSFLRSIQAQSQRVTEPDILEIYKDAVRKLNLKSSPALYRNGQIAAPMLIGTFCPVILLPAAGIGHNQIPYVLQHELTHFKRRDIFYKWLVQYAVCLHWFNPLVYWISKETERCCELSCDEAVVKNFDREEKVLYGDTLLDTINPARLSGHSIAAVHFSNETKLIKERLGAIMSTHKKSNFTIALTICLTVVLLCGASISGTYAAEEHSPLKAGSAVAQIPKLSLNAQADAPQQTAIFDYEKAQIVRILDAAGIENIVITGEVCGLILEETTEDQFEAYFSYSETTASNYEKYFDLQMRRSENGTVLISTEYDDHGFDPIEGYDDEDYSSDGVLLVKIPSKHYNQVDLSLTVIEDSVIDLNIDADTLNIRSHVDENVVFRSNRSYDNLYLDHYVGNLRLELNEPSKNVLIDNAVGLLTLAFPESPENISLSVHNKEDGEVDYPSSWAPIVTGNTYSYEIGDKSNVITVNNNWLGSLRAEVKGLPGPSVQNSPNTSIISAEYYTNLDDTSFVATKHYEIDRNGDYFTWGRIDVVDDSGYDHQGMVMVCSGSDDFTREYNRFISNLQAAYPDDYGYIAGYRNADNGPRTYRTMDIDFMVVEKITYTDSQGVARTGVVVAGDGSEEFTAKFGELYSRLYDAYIK